MSLVDAVAAAGSIPGAEATREVKKAYSEILSRHLAEEIAAGLRRYGFANVKPARGGPGEKEFQGGLGPKKVDVSFADEQHGLMLAVSVKCISFAPFGKNLKNRFSDLCTESITLHMRFPYSLICCLFALPEEADCDDAMSSQGVGLRRQESTFRRAMRLFGTIAGRRAYSDPDEKFEDFTMLRFRPAGSNREGPRVTLVDCLTEEVIGEKEYYQKVRDLYNLRNPHAPVGGDEEEVLMEELFPEWESD